MKDKVSLYIGFGLLYWVLLASVSWLLGFGYAILLGLGMIASLITVDSKK